MVVTYGDVPLLEPGTLQALLAEHTATGAAVTLLTAELADPTGYGRVLRGADGVVTGIVEHADATPEQRAIREINSGVYAFDAAFLTASLSGLASHNAQGELYLTDLVAAAAAQGRPAGGVACADTWQVQGVNDRVQLAQVRAELNRRVLERWMLAGVTVVDPVTTWVDVGVRLGRDVVLHPGTQLHGATVVDDGAQVGPDTTLTDVVVGAGATVVRTHGSSSQIGPDASVGPFAYLRPGAQLGPHGKIGTFVEVKNAEIGAGSKVPHLTYVGDATIGEQTNIGAASVFVNYDGVRKHRTVIGSHVRTGSDTMFIAPVQVGDGAYTGAGTVLREDVPPGALAVSAGSQRIIEGWVEKNRPGTPAAEAAGRYRSGASSDDGTESRRPRRPCTMSSISVTPKKNLMLFSGQAHPELAEQVAKHLDVTVTPQSAYSFANGEIFVRFEESVRGCDAFVLQAHCAPINDQIMEQLIMVDALKRASAKRISVVMPFWGYSRQDKKHRGREPISARLIADMFKVAGADRIMTVDLHTAQIQGFFDGPVDHLFALPVLAAHVKQTYPGQSLAVVSPDSGRVRLAERWSDSLGGTSLAFVHKTRDPHRPNEAVANRVVGEVEGRLCVVIDDMIDTGGTVSKTVEILLRDGASDVIVAATHGILSGSASEKLARCGAREVIFTDTLPIPDAKRFPHMTVLPIAPLLAEAIHQVFEDGSVTSLFDGNA